LPPLLTPLRPFNQFILETGDDTKERASLLKDLTLDEIITDIKIKRKNITKSGYANVGQIKGRVYLKDPKDDHVLEVAIASKTKMIITHNLKDFVGADKFGIKVVPEKILLETL